MYALDQMAQALVSKASIYKVTDGFPFALSSESNIARQARGPKTGNPKVGI